MKRFFLAVVATLILLASFALTAGLAGERAEVGDPVAVPGHGLLFDGTADTEADSAYNRELSERLEAFGKEMEAREKRLQQERLRGLVLLLGAGSTILAGIWFLLRQRRLRDEAERKTEN